MRGPRFIPHLSTIDAKTSNTVLIRIWKSLENVLAAPRPAFNPGDPMEFFEWEEDHEWAEAELEPVLAEMKRRGFPVRELP